MKCKVFILVFLSLLLACANTLACIWDAETMIHERLAHPDMAKLILGEPPAPPDPAPLRQRIQELTTSPQTNDPNWWNNLAGAHLRLGEANEAVALLVTVTNKFPDDYGIHANLGTAYHLLGRYADAEREIGRDLEINPDAHFGVEKYHLALLQYLVRDAQYQKDHVYVDEWSEGFIQSPSIRIMLLLKDVGTNNDEPPPYRKKWDLAKDPKFQDGVMYMATMNPKEPACFVMLGIACQRARQYNLAAAAYKRALSLGSPQADILRNRVNALEHYISESNNYTLSHYAAVAMAALVIGLYVAFKIHQRKRRKPA
jgi:Flp pilus assembly protein TadD